MEWLDRKRTSESILTGEGPHNATPGTIKTQNPGSGEAGKPSYSAPDQCSEEDSLTVQRGSKASQP